MRRLFKRGIYLPLYCVVVYFAFKYGDYVLYPNVPLDRAPTDLRSAKSLVRTIARQSNCSWEEFGWFPDKDSFVASLCFSRKLTDEFGAAVYIGIDVFLNSEGKERRINFLKSKSAMFKEGKHHIVVLTLNKDEDGDGSTDPITSPAAFADFPGELIQ